jgi:hypothetical protein
LRARKWQNEINPASGHTARDGRFLSHGAVECQSKRADHEACG